MNREAKHKFRCVLHGSFRRNFDEIRRVHKLFSEAGIEVLAPTDSEIAGVKNGFVVLETDGEADPRLIELKYLHHIKNLGENDFSYFVNPGGYMGKSVSYELGIAQLSNVRCFFLRQPNDHPAYFHRNSIWKPEALVNFIKTRHHLPLPQVHRGESTLHQLWLDLMVPGSVVAVGGIIEYSGTKSKDKEILLVRTHKWGGRWCIVGGKVKRNERLDTALLREINEETSLSARVGRHICTFDQIKNSGYYDLSVNHLFVDKVVRVASKSVVLNEEAQEHIWLPAHAALKELNIEPNARHTIQLYADMTHNHAI